MTYLLRLTVACAAAFVSAFVSLQAAAASQATMDEPKTVAEASGYTKTSTHQDVLAFLDKLVTLPHAKRLSWSTFGKSVEGRQLPLVIAAEPPLATPERVAASGKLRLLVNANIHAGEVEGKEAVQMLLRELAHGGHRDLLEHAVLLFVPIYNADGNERFDTRNRADQNGPDAGVGQRPNADGYDLNRDFIKLDAPETRALLEVFRIYDPHVFMDLHTTNGSHHGYHLTYSPSLSTSTDPALRAFTRKTLLPGIRKATLETHGFRIYDYGNFEGRPPRAWVTYDHRPRFGTNYFGLRNRIAVLSEAYSYISFEQRVAVTRAFVLETLRAAAAHRARIAELCAAADARCTEGAAGVVLGYQSRLEDPWSDEILIGSVERKRIEGAGIRLLAKPDYEARKLEVQTAFVAERQVALPRAWAILAPTGRLREALAVHGVTAEPLAETAPRNAEVFAVTRVTSATRPFQKHLEQAIEGAWQKRRVELPKGTLIVPARQRLARVAAQLLEPQSEDSLFTWNYFDADLVAGEDGKHPDFPVLRLIDG